MRPASSGKPIQTDGDGLADTRVRFLTAEPVEPGRVRQPILASWRRSRESNVAADRIKMPYIPDPNLDTQLSRSAEPVLRQLNEQLAGQPISIVLTDQAGLVLSRLTGDPNLARHLDTVQLAPGFSYAEEFVGTNGIGTALEGGQPMHVFGHEHYAEDLEDLACAGVPIQHPISGKTVGAVDLTCWRTDAGPLLMTLAKTTAGQIRQALLADAAAQEIELLQEYLRACRRAPGIVIALNNEVVMMNDYARTVLAPADQAALLQQATEALAGRRRTVLVDLPTGTRLRMYTRSLGAPLPAGGVIHAKVAQLSTPKRRDGGTVAKMLLPGLIGSGALWRRACDEVENAYRAGEWVALAGEPGVGKLAILRAVHQRRNPGERFTVLDAADATDPRWLASARRALVDKNGDEHAGSVVIRHPDRLDGVHLRSLTAALQEPTNVDGKRAVWVAVTLDPGAQSRDLARLLRLFPSTVEVPPLRHHIEDVEQLAPFFLARLGYQGQLICSPEVLQMLMRSNWPGNIEQVFQTMRQVVRRRRTGMIRPQDLPPETRALSRRLLSPLESIERDAITQSLLDAHGNKAQAAKALGMSRATIYRKIHEFGILTPAQ
ncbi:MAG TPA: helix-turn-helix domain-containing protein [Propionibacteriaceae bacterium]|nr:helix-turn-helix domain-containing protein [Propionibacteriaceae bacterium]